MRSRAACPARRHLGHFGCVAWLGSRLLNVGEQLLPRNPNFTGEDVTAKFLDAQRFPDVACRDTEGFRYLGYRQERLVETETYQESIGEGHATAM